MNLVQVIQATAEIYGKTMTPFAAEIFIADLKRYPESVIAAALTKCRRELRTFPTLADVIARIDDGHPGTEEAWSMIPKGEDGSVVWTDEMAEAFGSARHLLLDGDTIGARMAFKEVYQRLVADARNSGKRPNWSASFGFDKHGREAAVREAVAKNRIGTDEAQRLLPELPTNADMRKIAALVFKPMPGAGA